MTRKPRIAIIGAGMGGLATAAALHRLGIGFHIYEQAAHFARIGAGIQMSPNAMRVLSGLGLETSVRRLAFQPQTWNNREWDTGAVKYELQLGENAEKRFGAPYLQMHRADLHTALLSAVPPEHISQGKELINIERRSTGNKLSFSDGTTAEADLVIGADGVHSRVRASLLGPEQPVATGRVAYRATFSTHRLDETVGPCTKWWGPDRHIVIYYVTAARDEIYFVTSLPDQEWVRESWSATGDIKLVREAFTGFHDEVRAVLGACPEVHRWAILERPPLEHWYGEGMVLLGDAAHPMTPYMAQGAAMAMEDGVVLARCLARSLARETDTDQALALFETTRKARTAQVQAISHANTWMREETDPTWCYGYDAWSAPLAG